MVEQALQPSQLRARRQSLGLSQTGLAGLLGVTSTTVARWERSEQRIGHPERVSAAVARLETEAVGSTAKRPGSAVGSPSRLQNLPLQLGSLVGRELEVADVCRVARAAPLVSLVGPGGIGKTRLAIEVARRLQPDYPDGVWLIELAPLAEPSLVARSVAGVLGIGERVDQAPIETLSESIGDKQLLLVLDNCEHLIQACAELAESLLTVCAGLRIVTTSRQPLGIDAELTWRVPPLSLPPLGRPTTVENLGQFDAVRLFLQRAGRSRPGFALSPTNSLATTQVCRRLDGIPLALELAAARLNALTIEQIATRLDDSLGLLTSGSRTAADRQKTLRGTLDWSYDLLDLPEQLLLCRLAVFAGGWTLEAAEAICADHAIATKDILDLLSKLVDKSLVLAEDRGDAAWFRLLDPMRDYALEKLQASGEAGGVRSRHLDWYVELAEGFETDWRGPQQRAWFDRLEREEGNIRAGLRSCLDRGEINQGLRLAGALPRFWDLRSRLKEGRTWLDELLRVVGPSPDGQVRAKALSAAGYLAIYQGDTLSAEAFLIEGLRLWRGLGDKRGLADALVTLGMAAQSRDEFARATALYEEGLAVAREADDRVTTYWALSQLASTAQHAGDYVRAQVLHEESLALKRHLGFSDGYGIGMSLRGLGMAVWMMGDHDRAFALIRQSLMRFRDLGHWRGIASCVLLLAHLTAEAGEAEPAMQLFGAEQALHRAIGAVRISPLGIDTDATVRAIRATLAPPASETAWAAGEAMTIDEAVAFALGETPAQISQDVLAAADRTTPRSLTQREDEVLRLIVAGNSNQEIAVALTLSTRTVERHIANLYSKIGARNRADATAYGVRQSLA